MADMTYLTPLHRGLPDSLSRNPAEACQDSLSRNPAEA